MYVKWKGYDNSFNSWINKKDLVQKWVATFLNRLEILEETSMLKLIFQIMQQKLNLGNVTQVDTWSLALKTNLVSLKTEVDKLEIDKY